MKNSEGPFQQWPGAPLYALRCSRAHTIGHRGLQEYRKKAARLVAAKVALAARVDSYHEERSKGATLAISLRADILKKLSKAQEPPPAKIPKALPRPEMDAKKKRGGKRVRKMKERFSTSEIRKAANRMGFADIEEDVLQDEMGFSLGQLGKARCVCVCYALCGRCLWQMLLTLVLARAHVIIRLAPARVTAP